MSNELPATTETALSDPQAAIIAKSQLDLLLAAQETPVQARQGDRLAWYVLAGLGGGIILCGFLAIVVNSLPNRQNAIALEETQRLAEKAIETPRIVCVSFNCGDIADAVRESRQPSQPSQTVSISAPAVDIPEGVDRDRYCLFREGATGIVYDACDNVPEPQDIQQAIAQYRAETY